MAWIIPCVMPAVPLTHSHRRMVHRCCLVSHLAEQPPSTSIRIAGIEAVDALVCPPVVETRGAQSEDAASPDTCRMVVT